MKRFYKNAATQRDGESFRILLDGRPVKTPLHNILYLPCAVTAEKIAEEWRAQGEKIDFSTMKLTQLGYTLADKITAERAAVIAATAAFLETELICYYTPEPRELYERQKKLWQPAAETFTAETGIVLNSVTSVFGGVQSAADVAVFAKHLAALDDLSLTAAQAAAGLLGSAVLGYLLAKKQIDAAAAFQAALAEELYQAEKWGEDADAAARRDALKGEIDAVAAFLS